MNKSDRCDRCPDEHTEACKTCVEPVEPEAMTLTYTFKITDGIYNIDGLHSDLDRIVEDLGFEVVKSTLESPDEVSEHDFEEGAGEYGRLAK